MSFITLTMRCSVLAAMSNIDAKTIIGWLIRSPILGIMLQCGTLSRNYSNARCTVRAAYKKTSCHFLHFYCVTFFLRHKGGQPVSGIRICAKKRENRKSWLGGPRSARQQTEQHWIANSDNKKYPSYYRTERGFRNCIRFIVINNYTNWYFYAVHRQH